MGKTILLTGSSGLVGSPTRTALANAGHKILSVGRGSDNAIPDIDLAKDLLRERVDAGFDLVIHLAALIPGMAERVEEINQTIDDNVFSIVKDRNVPLIYASSGSVYGSCYGRETMTEELVCQPEIEYSKQKLRSEEWIAENLDAYYICRITAPYGPSERYQGVLKTFCTKAVCGEDIVLFGTGARCQDFIHVDDVAQLFCQMAKSIPEEAGIYNVSGGSPISMRSAAAVALEVAGNGGAVTYAGNADPQENFRALYSIAKVGKAFSWTPSVPLETGLEGLIKSLS